MIYIDPHSQSQLELVLASSAHALLLHGPKGVGLRTIAEHYVAPSYIVSPQLLTKASTVAQISVDQVRELYDITRGKATEVRYILIDDADAMTVPAQNSFLKLLEEPPEATKFILTSHMPDTMLPTIRSRLQEIYITPTSSVNEIIDVVTDSARKKQLQFIAGGLAAELTRLVQDEVYFRGTATEATLARKLMEANRYDRLVLLAPEKLDRQSALSLLQRCIQFASLSSNITSIQRIKALLAAYEAIQVGGNVRLHMAAAMV